MAGEVFTFSTAFYQAYVIRHDSQSIMGVKIEIAMYTDCKELFEVITQTAHTTENRLILEIIGAGEAHNRYEIFNVVLAPGDSNPANGLTKSKTWVRLNELL